VRKLKEYSPSPNYCVIVPGKANFIIVIVLEGVKEIKRSSLLTTFKFVWCAMCSQGNEKASRCLLRRRLNSVPQ